MLVWVRHSERLKRDLGGIRRLGRKQVRERGAVGQAGKDGFDDHRVFGVEIGAQGVGVSFALEDAAYRGDEVRPATLFHAGQDFFQLLAVFAMLNGHDDADNHRQVLPELVPGSGEVHLCLTAEAAVVTNLGLEFRLPVGIGRGLRLLSRNFGEDIVDLPNLRRAGVERLFESERLLRQLPRLGQPFRLL